MFPFYHGIISKPLKFEIFVGVFLMVSGSFEVFSQTNTKDALHRIVKASSGFQNRRPAEKIYVQTDKHEYFIGDTLWLKSYVFTAADLKGSLISPIAYVELRNRENELVRRLSMKITRGEGNVQIPLIQEIFDSGEHTILAYTTWMRNFDQQILFKKKIYINDSRLWLVNVKQILPEVNKTNVFELNFDLKTIGLEPVALKEIGVRILDDKKIYYEKEARTSQDGSVALKYDAGNAANSTGLRMELIDLSKNKTVSKTVIPLNLYRNAKLDLQFLPEGGHLVAGIKSKVGFKALNEIGLSMPVEGRIVDSKNNSVATFKSLHNGMGVFEFTPKIKEAYHAVVAGHKPFKLPTIQPAGSVMSVTNSDNKDSVSVTIVSSPGLITKGRYFLLGTTNGVVRFAQNISDDSKKVLIPKSVFPTGAAAITLIRDTLAICERMIFIDHNDHFNISLHPQKSAYKATDSIVLFLDVADRAGRPVKGSFSLAVNYDGLVSSDSAENFSIRTNLLLKSDIRGSVEDPGFYIHRKSPIAWDALDNLMLIQGWKSFEWKDVFSKAKPVKYEPETDLRDIEEYEGLPFILDDHVQFYPWVPNQTTFTAESKTSWKQLQEIEMKITGNVLREVEIVSKKRNYNAFNLNGYGQADIILDTNDIRTSKAAGLYQLLKQKWPELSIGYTYVGDKVHGMALKIKNQLVKIRIDEDISQMYLGHNIESLKRLLNKIKVDNLLSVEIMYSQKYLWKYFPPSLPKPYEPGERARIVERYAEAGMSPPTNEVKEYAVVQITTANKTLNKVYSFTNAMKFYTPKYSTDSAPQPIDFRPTVFWEHNITTDEFGKAKIIFYANRLPGSYTLNLQGADMNGHIGSYKGRLNISKQ
ncbi:MAG: hypothetical protein V4687_14410 [Bacteroidota bacterium]